MIGTSTIGWKLQPPEEANDCVICQDGWPYWENLSTGERLHELPEPAGMFECASSSKADDEKLTISEQHIDMYDGPEMLVCPNCDVNVRDKTSREYERGQWNAFDRVLNYLNTLGTKQVDKTDIYNAVMKMRPEA